MNRQPERILLVTSPGGHLMQMLALKPAWQELHYRFLTLRGPDTLHLLADEDVVFGHGPSTRSPTDFIRNLLLAWSTVREFEPDVMLSTGGSVSFPFFVIGRLLGVRLVYVESFTRVRHLGLTGRLVYPIADTFFVQWPTVRRRSAIYVGSIM
jgi:UDP-N-acetylglucosamine:LPS N-acetylglucosamine transferase